jgi:hypothetical protein
MPRQQLCCHAALSFEAIREFTRKAGVTRNNTPDTPTL